MDPNGRGDHHQVQAAAGRAVGGDAPSSVTESAPAAASFLPPPAPLAVDAAVQPRAADSEHPTPPPASAAAATATGIKNSPSDDKDSIKESMEHIERDDGAQVPPVHTDAEYEEMENTIRRSVARTRSEDVPLHPSQIAVLADANRGADETDAKKKPALTTEKDGNTPPTPPAVSPPHVREEVIITPTLRQQTIIVRPPPQSMLPSPDEDTVTPSVPVPASPREPSDPVLRATLVEDRPEAIVVPDLPVYDAVQVAEQTRFEKNKKLIIGVGVGLLIGAAVAAGVSASAIKNTSGSNTVKPKGAVPSPPVYCGEINILTDDYPEETSWQIQNTVTINGISYPNEIVLVGAPENAGHHTYEVCLERGDYKFAIYDRCDDGIYSPGYYTVTFEGVTVAQGGGDFGYEEIVSFSLPIWNRQGLGFNGDASDDIFGHAVAFSADASTMAVGSPGVWGNEDRPGYVKVYRREGEGSSWEQRGDTIHGKAIGDNFGFSLSLSEDGTTLSIGAPLHDSVGPDSGQVKVYEWDNAALDYMQIGDALYGAVSSDHFGYSLDISNGKILAVGAEEKYANGPGRVAVYAWDDASTNFKQRGEVIVGTAARALFGISVSLSENGQKLAIGAPGNNPNGRGSGQVKVFEWDEATSNYEQLGGFLLGDADWDGFGYFVSFSLDGTTLAVGAPKYRNNGVSSGQVKVFALDKAASNFKQIGQSLFGKEAGDYFGWSVALSSEGKTLAIGAPQCCSELSAYGKTLAYGVNSYTGKPGYVEVYEWDETASEYKRLVQSLGGEESDDWFGSALDLAGNGRVLAIGATRNDRHGTDSGRVEVSDVEL